MRARALIEVLIGQSNLTASVEKNVADAKAMSPDDPVGFLKMMVERARAQGKEDAARGFEEAIAVQF